MPGSGKGTQGAVLGQLPSFVHISMGDVFRKIPRNGKFGREIEQYTSQGLMVPDDLTVRIFERHLKILEMQELLMPEQHTLVLDGLPRSYAQAERLAGFIDVIQIFHLKIDNTAMAIERLRARALRENRLDDMSDEVIHRRLQTYYDETFQTLSFYPQRADLRRRRRPAHDRRPLRHRQPPRRDHSPRRPRRPERRFDSPGSPGSGSADARTPCLDGAPKDMSTATIPGDESTGGRAARRRPGSSRTSRTRPSCPS